MISLRFERKTYCLEGSCSIQLSYETNAITKIFYVFVGIAGFEPATSCSQSRRDNRTTLHPEFFFWRRKGDSNPRYPNRVRQFSKLLVSATHPSLRDQFRFAKVLTFSQLTKFYRTFLQKKIFHTNLIRLSTYIYQSNIFYILLLSNDPKTMFFYPLKR